MQVAGFPATVLRRMQHTRRARRSRVRPRRWPLAVAVLAALGLVAAPASGAITIGTVTIPLPVTVPGLSPSPAQGATPPAKTKKKTKAHAASANPFATRGMWIWDLPDSSGGKVSSIIARARRYGIGT